MQAFSEPDGFAPNRTGDGKARKGGGRAQSCSLRLVALRATYRPSLTSPLKSIINAFLNGQLGLTA